MGFVCKQVDFLEDLPAMDTAEMEELYRHFLVDEMPEVRKVCPACVFWGGGLRSTLIYTYSCVAAQQYRGSLRNP